MAEQKPPERPSIRDPEPRVVAGGEDREQIVRRILSDPGALPASLTDKVLPDTAPPGSALVWDATTTSWVPTLPGGEIGGTFDNLVLKTRPTIAFAASIDAAATTNLLLSGGPGELTIRALASGWGYLTMEGADPLGGGAPGAGVKFVPKTGVLDSSVFELFTENDIPDRLYIYSTLNGTVARFASQMGGAAGKPGMEFGEAGDAKMWRHGANLIKTNTGITIDKAYNVNGAGATEYAIATWVSGGANDRFEMLVNGQMSWGDGTNPLDVNLYRAAANVLQTDDTFTALGGIVLGGSAEFYTSDASFFINTVGGLEWGLGDWTRDTNLYRAAANLLRTQDGFQVSDDGNTSIYIDAWGGYIQFRAAAGSGGGLKLGPVGGPDDTNLYRSAANQLKTDDALEVVGLLTPTGGISGYAPLASPAFTGDPTAPTPARGDNDTSIATSAFVRSAVAAARGSSPPASPVDGDRWIYKGSDFYWEFEYDSAETTYKWKFIGGPPLSAYNGTDRGTTGTTTFTDPVVTVPLAGDYLVSYSVLLDGNPNVNTQTTWNVFLWKNDTTELTDSRVNFSFVADVGGFVEQRTGASVNVPQNFAASDTIKMRGTPTNWDFTTRHREISIIPKRISA